MGKRGPIPEPLSLKALKGTVSRRRLAKATPVQPGTCEPPDFLDDRERVLFAKIMASPLARRIIGDASWPLGRYVSYLRLWGDAKRALDASGSTVVRVKSRHVERDVRAPSLADMLSLESVLSALEDKLGLNAASRQRLVADLSLLPQAAPAATEGEDDERLPSPIGWGVRH